MNKMTKIVAAVLVLAGVLLAILALTLGGRRPVQAPQPSSQALAAQYPVVVAARALQAGQPVAADALKIVKLPNRPDGSFANVADVIGQVPQATIAADAPVTGGALAHGIAMQLAAGERAIAIPVNEVVGVGNRVQPGDYVDLFVSLKAGQDAGDTQSRLLASHLRVLSYGARSLDDARNAAGASAGKVVRPAPAMSAVLAVPLDEVNPVALAAQNGRLLLALRPPKDDSQPDPSLFPQPAPVLAARGGLDATQRDALDTPENRAYAGIALAGLTGDAKTASRHAAARVPAPRGGGQGRSIEVIRGAQRESVAF